MSNAQWVPRGSSSGARLRAYRNAAFSTLGAGTLSGLTFDALSTLVAPFNLEISAGKLRALTSGVCRVQLTVSATGILLLSAVRVVFTRTRSGAADRVFADRRHAAPTSGAFSFEAGGAIDVLRGDLIAVDVASIGAGSVSFTVGSEVGTWIEGSVS